MHKNLQTMTFLQELHTVVCLMLHCYSALIQHVQKHTTHLAGFFTPKKNRHGLDI